MILVAHVAQDEQAGTPMIERFWNKVGGTIVPEFQAVPRSKGVGRRLLDAVILPGRTKTHRSAMPESTATRA